MIASLFLGESGGGRLLQADQGSHDDGVPVYARLETVAAGPGVGGEAIFPALYLALTHDVDATIDITPILSGMNDDGTPFERELEVQQILVAATAERMTVQHQLGLSEPYLVDGEEMGRWAPRGNQFRARVVALVHSQGDLVFEGIGVEMEVVTESLPTLALAPVPAGS